MNENVYIFNGLNVPKGQVFTNLDVVAVIGRNLMVGEMKNYNGFLRGNISDVFWYGGSKGKVYKIYNPLKQNRTHIEYLTKAMISAGITMRGLRMLDYIVVNNTCKLEMPDVLKKVVISQATWETKAAELSLSAKESRMDVIDLFRGWV
jgi:hypothetical protein